MHWDEAQRQSINNRKGKIEARSKGFGKRRGWIIVIDAPFDERGNGGPDEAKHGNSEQAEAEAFQQPEISRARHWIALFD